MHRRGLLSEFADVVAVYGDTAVTGVIEAGDETVRWVVLPARSARKGYELTHEFDGEADIGEGGRSPFGGDLFHGFGGVSPVQAVTSIDAGFLLLYLRLATRHEKRCTSVRPTL